MRTGLEIDVDPDPEPAGPADRTTEPTSAEPLQPGDGPDRTNGSDGSDGVGERDEDAERYGDELDEVTLVGRAQDGDLAAFERLVERYQRPLFGLALRMLDDRGDAEDVVQETLVAAWRRLPLLSQPAAFGGWVYKVATNRSLDLIRRRAGRRTDVTDVGLFDRTVTADPGPGDQARLAAEQAELRRLLAELTPEQRACWLLYELHGRHYAEIATIVGATETAVRGRIARARQHLAGGMAPWR